jgi:hypothetical protein
MQHIWHSCRVCDCCPKAISIPASTGPHASWRAKRIQLGRRRTSQVLSMENLVARHTGARPSCAQIKRLTADQVGAIQLSPDIALALKANLAIFETLQQHIAILEKRLSRHGNDGVSNLTFHARSSPFSIRVSMILRTIGSAASSAFVAL